MRWVGVVAAFPSPSIPIPDLPFCIKLVADETPPFVGFGFAFVDWAGAVSVA